MMTSYQTIEYKEKLEKQYNDKIRVLLSDMPSFCSDYEIYLRNLCELKTRVEYLSDIFNFFRYLLTISEYRNVKDIKTSYLEKMTGLDFDRYLSWLTDYKFDISDPKEKEKRNTNASKKRKMMAIKSLFHFLYVRDYINCNPSEKATLPRVKSKDRAKIVVLEDDECQKFLNAIDKAYDMAIETLNKKNEEKRTKAERIKPYLIIRDKAIVCLILQTGLRISELCAINCSDISFDLGYINVIRKGDEDGRKTSDQVYLSEEVKSLLLFYINEARDYLEPDEDNYDALFISSKKQRITPRGIELMVKQYANTALGANNNIHPHTLRATFGTRYYQMTKDISATSTAMNHSSIEVTAQYYVKADKDAKRKAAEIVI